jgi:hypothetical protein
MILIETNRPYLREGCHSFTVGRGWWGGVLWGWKQKVGSAKADGYERRGCGWTKGRDQPSVLRIDGSGPFDVGS